MNGVFFLVRKYGLIIFHYVTLVCLCLSLLLPIWNQMFIRRIAFMSSPLSLLPLVPYKDSLVNFTLGNILPHILCPNRLWMPLLVTTNLSFKSCRYSNAEVTKERAGYSNSCRGDDSPSRVCLVGVAIRK